MAPELWAVIGGIVIAVLLLFIAGYLKMIWDRLGRTNELLRRANDLSYEKDQALHNRMSGVL